MATFKRYFKLIISFIAFAVISFIFAVSPVFTSYAATSYDAIKYAVTNYKLAMNSIKMPKGTIDMSVEGKEFVIPLLSSSFGETEGLDSYTIRVVDPAGQNHDYVVQEDLATNPDADEFFDDSKLQDPEKPGLRVNVRNSGKYSIVYVVTIGDKTYYSNTYSVTVKNVSYELDFSIREGENAGLNVLLPSNMAPSTEEIELPVANVKLAGEDEYVELSEMIKPVVYYNGAILDENEVDGKLRFDEGAQRYYLTPSEEGRYTIEYTYNYGANRPTQTFVINVSEDFVEPTVDDLRLTVQSMPTIELGDIDVTLPSITVSDGISNNASFNLKSIEITKSNNSEIKQTLTNNTYTFNMTTGEDGFTNVTDYRDLVGNYLVKYTIVDAYGNEKSIQVRLSNVTDNTAPTIHMAYDYELEGEAGNQTPTTTTVDGEIVDDVNTNYAVDLKANYGWNELVFPAIYATDSVSKYSDFTFVRYIQNTNTRTIYYLDNYKFEDGELVEVTEGETGYNYAADVATNPGYRNYNKAVRFQFTENGEESDISRYAGEYTLGYYVYSNTIKVQESNLYSSGTTRYSFNILSRATVGSEEGLDEDEQTTPITNISNIKNNDTVSSNEDLTVYISATDEGDSRLKNAVFYYYNSTSDTELDEGYSSVFEQDLYTAMKAILANDESDTKKHKCNLLDDPQLITKMVNLGYNGFAVATQDEVNNTEFVVDFTGYSENPNITIVAVSLNDYNRVGIDSRTLTIENSTETDAPEFDIIEISDGNYGSLISGGNVLEDGSLVFNQAEDVILPAIQFTDADSTLAMNVVYYVNSPETEKAGLQYLSTSGKVFGDNSIIGGTIKTTQVGTYYVIYTATDDAGNTTSVYFTFVVEDSSDPILNVEVTSDDEISKSGNTVTAEMGSTITFDPTLYASDGKQVLPDDGVVVTVDDNGGLDYEKNGNSYTFNDVGSYTVKVTGEYDGRTAVERVIYVNITLPEMTWDNEITVQTTARTGQDVYLPYLTASQGDETATVVVNVLDPDGHTPVAGDAKLVTLNGYQVWMFTTNENSKGTYTVTYTATTSNASIEQSFEIKVGDNVAPTFTIVGEDVLGQDLIYDGETEISYQINLNRSKNTLEIVVKSGDTTIYTHDTKLEIWDRDDSGSSRKMTSWTNLTVELTGDNVSESSETTGLYTISGTGECTLTLTMTDSYSNTATKEIKFEVVTETAPEDNTNDTVVGTVLIVLSLVILAGVILFFTFTGKKGGTSRKSRKTSEIVEETSDNNTESQETVETKDSTDEEPKSGEVE